MNGAPAPLPVVPTQSLGQPLHGIVKGFCDKGTARWDALGLGIRNGVAAPPG